MKFVLIVVSCILAYVSATEVKPCNDYTGINYDDLSDRINLNECVKPPCRLRRGSFQKVELKINPDHDVKGVITRINAQILGASIPFPGVDETSSCPFLFEEDKKTVVKNCDLKAGKTYYFLNGFDVLQIYPKIKTVVHWELIGSDKKSLICFETLVRITS